MSYPSNPRTTTRDIPRRLGRYEIVELLSTGGMGEVFVARMLAPGGFVKPVAIKLIRAHLVGDAEFVDMLHDEARLSAMVRHPSIVACFDVGSEGGEHFIVMDYVAGEHIGRIERELRRRGERVPPWVAAFVVAQTAAALHAVHEARALDGSPLEMIHRDVSPGNIMLADAGHAMLFDFGVAKARQRLHHTTHGEIKGKLPYMAPETFSGVSPDRSVDIFGLGVVLYELLTGHSPFARPSDVEIIAALKNAEILPPSQRARGIDADLDAIVLRAMARERADRMRTAAELERALRDWAVRAGLPHDAGAVAGWLAGAFPERLAARRDLLARVASGSPGIPPAADSHASAVTTVEGAEPTTLVTPTVAGLSRHTTAARIETAPSVGPRSNGWLAALVAVAGIALVGLGLIGFTRMSRETAPPPSEAATPPPPVELPADPTPSPVPVAQPSSAPAASSVRAPAPPPQPARPAAPRAPASSSPPPAPSGGKRGPLVREWG
jgi:eukaryotic-like serine/threonine-protein kinase